MPIPKDTTEDAVNKHVSDEAIGSSNQILPGLLLSTQCQTRNFTMLQNFISRSSLGPGWKLYPAVKLILLRGKSRS